MAILNYTDAPNDDPSMSGDESESVLDSHWHGNIDKITKSTIESWVNLIRGLVSDVVLPLEIQSILKIGDLPLAVKLLNQVKRIENAIAREYVLKNIDGNKCTFPIDIQLLQSTARLLISKIRAGENVLGIVENAA